MFVRIAMQKLRCLTSTSKSSYKSNERRKFFNPRITIERKCGAAIFPLHQLTTRSFVSEFVGDSDRSIRRNARDVYKIDGGRRLSGTVPISGSKNASLVVLVAALLTREQSQLHNVPDILDIHTLLSIFSSLGVTAKFERTSEFCGTVSVDPTIVVQESIAQNMVSSIRASFWLAGPLLARSGKATLAKPGGCQIGNRPVNLHLDVLMAMGARIRESNGLYEMSVDKLHGADVTLPLPSVGATCTFMLTAALATGSSKLTNAALEPEVAELAQLLNSMGCHVQGAGTRQITVQQISTSLHGYNWKVMPDRIECGTYMIAAAITQSTLKMRPAVQAHMSPVITLLQQCGCEITMTPTENENQCEIQVVAPNKPLNSVDVYASPYPGFPTDMLPQISALLATCEGASVITDSVFEGRIQAFAPMFTAMKVGIHQLNHHQAIIFGLNANVAEKESNLVGCIVQATDLRAGAALVLAALAAEGSSIISNTQQIRRGYPGLHTKLTDVGASISLQTIAQPFDAL